MHGLGTRIINIIYVIYSKYKVWKFISVRFSVLRAPTAKTIMIYNYIK